MTKNLILARMNSHTTTSHGATGRYASKQEQRFAEQLSNIFTALNTLLKLDDDSSKRGNLFKENNQGIFDLGPAEEKKAVDLITLLQYLFAKVSPC